MKRWTSCHTLRGCVDWNPIIFYIEVARKRHTLRGCVDWNDYSAYSTIDKFESHPAWVCGLKLTLAITDDPFFCHTLRGCVDWNEKSYFIKYSLHIVTPCVGVWIETMKYLKLTGMCLSHPAWVCGLKHVKHACKPFYNSHTLRGCVDWNSSFAVSNVTSSSVTPCVGVWIETNQVYGYPDYPGHTLRGCVDWNFWFYLLI